MKIRVILVLICILTLGAILRFYHLGSNPPSLDWDEASLGWNAYSILKTGTDEYGKAWPVSIRSFGDYKPPLYVYAAVPSIAVFGLNEFAVRFPSALAGVLTILAAYFLVRKLTQSNKLALLTCLLLAISPWSLQFSRAAFEANLALLFFVTGATFLIHFLEKQNSLYILLATASFALSIYSYHSPRIVVPLFLLGIIIYYRKIFLSRWHLSVLSLLLFALLLFPLVRNTVHVGSVQARFETVTLLNAPGVDGNWQKLPAKLAANYFSHFDFDFLFLKADGNMRHHVPDVGLLYLIEAPFLVIGLVSAVKNKVKWGPFLFLWFLSAPVASAIATGAPHPIRSELFLPTFQVLTAYGLLQVLRKKIILSGLLCLAMSINIFHYLHQYHVHFPIEFARNWQFGYREAVKEVLAREANYPAVYITTLYDQPYIYFLFYGRVSPIIKNNGFFYKGFDKYNFFIDNNNHKGLYVLAPMEDHASLTVLKTIKFPDGTAAFDIAERR